MLGCLLVFLLEYKLTESDLSGASLCGSNHSLLDALGAFKIFEALLLEDINVKFLHDLQDDIETLEEAIYRDTKHPVGSSAVDGAKYGSIVCIRGRLCGLNGV
jgi:hypothetical protein